jgi:iron complex outermembrane receptor protein
MSFMVKSNKSNVKLRSRLAAALLAASALIPLSAPAFAQTVDGEIVVTARLREEAAKDVPVSISTYSAEDLETVTAGGADLTFLAGRTPSVNVESSFGRTFPRVYIRGLGNSDFDLNASQPVSIVMDDVVQENPVLKGFPVFDVNQIEVLRGPQGTLFGRNTPAGVLKFNSNRPGVGAPNYVKVEARSLGGISVETASDFGDNTMPFTMRASALVNTQDDWVDNRAPGAIAQLGGYTDIALRLQARYSPNSDLDMSLNLHGREFDGTGQLFRGNGIRTGGGLAGGFDRETVFYDGGANNPQVLRTYGAVGKIDWDLGGLILTSITGYETIDEFFSRGDIDGGVAVAPPASAVTAFPSDTSDAVADHEQITQELRLSNTDGGAVQWLIGAYYFKEELGIESLAYAGPTATFSRATLQQDSDAWAVFGSASIKPTDALTLTAGVRYSDDQKDFVGTGTLGGAVTRRASVGDNAFSWDLSAVWELNQDANAYARIARGYRAPAIQGRLLFPGPGAQITTAESEFLTSYEVGYKAVYFNGMVRADASVFYYTVDDQQFTAIGGAGNFNQLLNAEEGVGQGFEADIEYTPSENWAFKLGVAYNDTEIKDPALTIAVCGAPCSVLDPVTAGLARINGNSFPNAPEWTANLAAKWQTRLADGAGMFVSTDWAYKGETNFFLYDSREFREDGFWEGGLRAGWMTPDDRFAVTVFGRNITDEERLVGGIDFNNLTGFLNAPRIYGVELKASF